MKFTQWFGIMGFLATIAANTEKGVLISSLWAFVSVLYFLLSAMSAYRDWRESRVTHHIIRAWPAIPSDHVFKL